VRRTAPTTRGAKSNPVAAKVSEPLATEIVRVAAAVLIDEDVTIDCAGGPLFVAVNVKVLTPGLVGVPMS
jgi:hypothetical protein